MSRSSKSLETRLGQVLIRKKSCSLREVNEALAEQRRGRRGESYLPLGEILMRSGVLQEAHLREALAELGAQDLLCETCGHQEHVSTCRTEVDDACPQCGNDRVSTDPEEFSGGVINLWTEQDDSHVLETTDGVETVAAESRPLCDGASYIGKVLGGCQIESKIAHGGMGVVYRAVQLNLGRIVAIKLLSEDLAKDRSFVRRFLQEARAAAQLNHGGIVHINDVGEQQGVFYFVMEFVDGQNLKEILEVRKYLDIGETIEIMIQVCHALRHAHSRGIIHRDIKPENIMITRDGVVKLADLGLAKRVSDKSVDITHAGSILGTPFYMPPEQAKDLSKVDERSDIYSLGVSMYRMISGKVPFYGRSPIEVLIKVLDGKKAPMHELRQDVPKEVETLVDVMMQRLPDERFQSVEDVLEELVRVDVLLKSAATT